MEKAKKKPVSFSLREDQHQMCTEYADRKGLTLSQFAKMTMFNYIQKYPGKKKLKHGPYVSPEPDAVKPHD